MPVLLGLRVLTLPLVAATAFAAGALVTGPDPGGPATDGPRPAPAGGTAPAAAVGAPVAYAEDCADLLDEYVDAAAPLVGPWGWAEDRYPHHWDETVELDAFSGAARSQAVPTAGTARATSSATGTNVQEAGVDEPDVVKTDGELLVRLRGDDLTTYDVGDGTAGTGLEPLGRLDLDDAWGGELLLSGDTVVVVAPRTTGARRTTVVTVDVSDPAAPEVTGSTTYDGEVLGARLHGTTVRVVLAAPRPSLAFVQPRQGRSAEEAERHNLEVLERSTIDDWLPTADGEPLLECDRVAVPDDDSGPGTVAVVGAPADRAADPQARDARGVLTESDVAYFSADHLYLAAAHDDVDRGCCWGGAWRGSWQDSRQGSGSDGGVLEELRGTTTIHALALSGAGSTYLASGVVEGRVADRWSLDEADGVLRLAVEPTSRTARENAVVTMRRDGAALVEAGRLGGLGVGQRLTSVRWFDGLALLVTFRQVDPLYAVDLTDDRRPRLLGELHVPGFSAYLHPLGRHRLVGLGSGPQAGRGWGGQAGLFRVTDLTDVRRLDVHGWGSGSQVGAATDPRQVTWLPEQRTLLTVVSRRHGASTWVAALHLDGGRFHPRTLQVEHGRDGAVVRTVPLPDGRVVLVTGDGVGFLDVAALSRPS